MAIHQSARGQILYSSPFTLYCCSFHPVCDEDVRLSGNLIVAIRCEHELLAIWAEHWKTIEGRVICYSLEPRPVDVDHVEIKVSSFWISLVGSKDDALPVGKEVGREIRGAIVGHLA